MRSFSIHRPVLKTPMLIKCINLSLTHYQSPFATVQAANAMSDVSLTMHTRQLSPKCSYLDSPDSSFLFTEAVTLAELETPFFESSAVLRALSPMLIVFVNPTSFIEEDLLSTTKNMPCLCHTLHYLTIALCSLLSKAFVFRNSSTTEQCAMF